MSRKDDIAPDPPPSRDQPGRAPAGERETERPTSQPGGPADTLSPLPNTGRVRRPYLAKLAHELRTPLSAIVSASEIMRDEQFGPLGDERYRGYSNDINQTARHALDVIDRMLASRRTARIPAEPERRVVEIDVPDMLITTASSLATLAQTAGVRLETRYDDALPHLIADALHIRQILINLLTNALKFTPAGGRIELAARFVAQRQLDLSVSDSGAGMAAETIAQIIAAGPASIPQAPIPSRPDEDLPAGPQPDAGAALRGRGLGFGLALVQQLAHENGGQLALYSPQPSGLEGTQAVVSFGMNRLAFV